MEWLSYIIGAALMIGALIFLLGLAKAAKDN